MNILKENIKVFEDNKIDIIKYWINSQAVLNTINKYNIEKEIFIKDYAFGIIDYYIGVVNEKNEIGHCPVINNLMLFLKDKNVSSEDLFFICSGFKDALVEFTHDYNINSKQIIKDINYIFEHNFAGVLREYSKTISEAETKITILDEIIDKNIIMSTTDIKGIILNVSSAFVNISGYTKEELMGQPHNLVRHPDMPSEAFSQLWETILAGNIWKGEVKNLKKDGAIYWVYAIISPNFDINTNIIGFTSIRQDITTKKEADEQQQVIIEQSTNTAMGDMISMLAHQWRQPLQVTAMLIQQLTLEKMLAGKVDDDTLDKVVDGTQKQLDYMSKTITDFTDFFRPDKSMVTIKVSELVEKARDLMAYTLKIDGIELNISGDDGEITTHGSEVSQVIVNLLKNANDILMERSIENKKIDINYYIEDNKNATIEIRDNAGGISEDILPKIFEPYFTTKRTKNGSGLGLYLSKTTIEKHANGTLMAFNGDDGAIFKIILPIN